MIDLDIISQDIRNQIISGKDVNSNLLLIPNYQTPIKIKDHDNNERLSRNLSLVEFIISFDRYKRIMCSAFSSRAEELDLYKFGEVIILNTTSCLLLSVLQHNIKMDWSRGYVNLRQKMCAGSREYTCTCSRCNSTLHTTAMCQKSRK